MMWLEGGLCLIPGQAGRVTLPSSGLCVCWLGLWLHHHRFQDCLSLVLVLSLQGVVLWLPWMPSIGQGHSQSGLIAPFGWRSNWAPQTSPPPPLWVLVGPGLLPFPVPLMPGPPVLGREPDNPHTLVRVGVGRFLYQELECALQSGYPLLAARYPLHQFDLWCVLVGGW